MTTQATHTPGPWTISIDRDKYDSSRDVIRVRAEEDRNHPQGPLTVARVNQYLADESVANARLIAAAPDLLEALKSCRSNMRILAKAAGCYSSFESADNAAREAIEKATGRATE